MKVEVRLFASLGRYRPDGHPRNDPLIAEVAGGTTIRELLHALGVPLTAVKVLFLNGVHASSERKLQDGDRLGVFPPVAGG